ncbi:hypothetical protein SAMN05443579_12025 [Variovorax sp. PDC80]|nr:hypothetical protein SAMN05443579_12025 [Variovorax sp. PDC80]
MDIYRFCKALIGCCGLLAGLAAFAQQPLQGVLGLSYKIGRPSVPAAAYQKITVAEFRSMVSKAFQKSGFSLVAVDAQKNKSTIFQFRFDAYPKVEPKPMIFISADELPDERKRCNPCFLRFAEIRNASEFETLPWMTQYELSALLVPAIDNAYATIESNGHRDPAWERFNYKRQWAGERNLFGNSFTGIEFSSLKEAVAGAYRNAGFIPVESLGGIRTPEDTLAFSFPVDPGKDGGAIYTLKLRRQYDADGRCYPCEVVEEYDPYQQLPPAGLSGIVGRATLESRFTAARSAAYEAMRADLERHLRPGSVFSIPPKQAPLGSPRPPPTPPIAT